MNFVRRRFLQPAEAAVAALAVAAMSLVALPTQPARSQTTRTIKIVVAVPPGGAADIVARLLAEQIGRTQGQSMVIENRPGAANIIGTEAVSRAAPDGNTLLLITPAFVINPHLRRLNYDTLTSFEPICYLVRTPTVIGVNSASPYRTLADLMNAARAKPGELTLAAAGPATLVQIAFEKLKRAANVNLTFVPYPGGASVVTALLGEHVTSAFSDYPGAAEHLKAGKLRALAIAARTRIEVLPDVPTVAESGYKDSEADLWYGVAAPTKTPKETVSQLAGWFTAALQVADVKAKLAVQGFYPVGMCGAEFGAYVRKQHDEFGRVIRESNIRAE
jgi:tripartite-type tricarboxylate transporter receptor subunit TctC